MESLHQNVCIILTLLSGPRLVGSLHIGLAAMWVVLELLDLSAALEIQPTININVFDGT
jgi:hypothetical protein